MYTTREPFTNRSLLSLVRSTFNEHHKDPPKRYYIPTVDNLMSGLAVFSLKYPSLLQFEDERLSEKTLRHNLRTLYGVHRAPCDTQMRARLDGLGLTGIRSAGKSVINRLQRGKVLEQWKFMDNHCLLGLGRYK